LKSDFKDEVVEKCLDQWKTNRYSNIFDFQVKVAGETPTQEGDAESVSEGESLRSVLSFIKGSFAMDLAKNLVDLITFRQRQS